MPLSIARCQPPKLSPDGLNVHVYRIRLAPVSGQATAGEKFGWPPRGLEHSTLLGAIRIANPQALGGRGLVYAAVYVVAVGARDAHGETPEGIALTGATS